MSFNDREISTQDGRPVALYFFKWGPTEWRYTSADRKITIQEPQADGSTVAKDYLPQPMKDSGMVQGESAQNDFTVDAPTNLPIVALFRGTPPSESIWLTVRRQHIGDADAPIYWKGNVTNVKRPDPARAQIIGRPLSASLDRTGARLCWTRECPHFLYDVDCRVNRNAFKITGVVKSLTAISLVVEAVVPSDQWLRGGYVEWQASVEGTKERRFIEAQTNALVANKNRATLSIFGLTDGVVVGQAVSLYPGCDRMPETCDGKYDNIDNYGGFDKMPGKTPFGTSIF